MKGFAKLNENMQRPGKIGEYLYVLKFMVYTGGYLPERALQSFSLIPLDLSHRQKSSSDIELL